MAPRTSKRDSTKSQQFLSTRFARVDAGQTTLSQGYQMNNTWKMQEITSKLPTDILKYFMPAA